MTTEAMTKEELWKIYEDRNPSFKDENATVTMTARGLKKLFDQTWEQGYERGKAVESAMSGKKSAVDDILKRGRGFF